MADKKMTPAQQRRERIVDGFLLEAGWRPNYRYINNLDVRGRWGRWQENYLIGPDGKYAVTIKRTVLTVHDSQRQYCKIISMKLNEIEQVPQGIKCGQVMLLYHDYPSDEED